MIRIGLIFTMFASALLVPWSAVIAVQMSRIEGKRPVLAITQVAQASLLSLEFIIPLMVWQTAAYRPSPARIHLVYMLNDMGWLMFVVLFVGGDAVPVSGHRHPDRQARPADLPALVRIPVVVDGHTLAPAGVVPLFKDGPFAWNGLLGFWAPLSIFCVWVSTTTWLLITAIKREADDPAEQPSEALA